MYVSNGSHILKYSKDDARVDVVYGKVGNSSLIWFPFVNSFLACDDLSSACNLCKYFGSRLGLTKNF